MIMQLYNLQYSCILDTSNLQYSCILEVSNIFLKLKIMQNSII